MDFKLVMEKLLAAFEGQGVRYALAGGFAMGLWGAARATVDMDFLISRDDLEKVDEILKHLGYECRYRSENVSQYISPLDIFGEIDLLHAFRGPSLKMLERAEEKGIFGGALNIRVLRPEDIIGLKLQAIKNNPSRKRRETDDIMALLETVGNEMNRPLIEEYARILGMEDLYKEILGREDR